MESLSDWYLQNFEQNKIAWMNFAPFYKNLV